LSILQISPPSAEPPVDDHPELKPAAAMEDDALAAEDEG
jgi:hypothetical protein